MIRKSALFVFCKWLANRRCDRFASVEANWWPKSQRRPPTGLPQVSGWGVGCSLTHSAFVEIRTHSHMASASTIKAKTDHLFWRRKTTCWAYGSCFFSPENVCGLSQWYVHLESKTEPSQESLLICVRDCRSDDVHVCLNRISALHGCVSPWHHSCLSPRPKRQEAASRPPNGKAWQLGRCIEFHIFQQQQTQVTHAWSPDPATSFYASLSSA